MRGVLSLPALLALAWAIAGLLWLDHRRHVIAAVQVPWTMAAMALVTVAMALMLVCVPAPLPEQGVRAFLMVEGGYGFWVLARRSQDGSRDGR